MQGEPKRAMLPAYLLCAAGVLIGAIDVIAPIVSMCFLTCYATINFSCFVMAVTQVHICAHLNMAHLLLDVCVTDSPRSLSLYSHTFVVFIEIAGFASDVFCLLTISHLSSNHLSYLSYLSYNSESTNYLCYY